MQHRFFSHNFSSITEKQIQTWSTKKEFDASKVKVFNPENDSYEKEFEAKGYELFKWIVFHVRLEILK